jgi:hypothetical protein
VGVADGVGDGVFVGVVVGREVGVLLGATASGAGVGGVEHAVIIVTKRQASIPNFTGFDFFIPSPKY